MSIRFMRVDARLLHGQILVKYAEYCGCGRICIVDDETAGNIVKRRILEMSCPAGYDCSIYSVDEMEREEKPAESNIFVIVKYVETAYRLFQRGLLPEQLNLGNVPYKLGKKKINNSLFLTEEEIMMVKELVGKTEVFYQAVPDDRKYTAEELFAELGADVL